MKESLLNKLAALCARHEEIAGLLSDIEVINDQDRFRNLWGPAAAIEEAAHRGPGTYAQEHYTLDSARKEASKSMSYVFSASSVRECKRDWALPAEIEC